MRPLSFLLAGAAMFVAALTVNAATVCQGKILNPVTDVCWSCVFPVKIGGKASLTTSVLPDPDTGAGGPFCTCGKGLNLRAASRSASGSPFVRRRSFVMRGVFPRWAA